jgi:hypothetical protein
MTNVIPLNPILTPAYIEAVRQTIGTMHALPDYAYWDDEDEEIINRREVEEALRHIAIACGGTSFTDFIMSRQINIRRLSDHLLYDLKYDDTLPETFDSLEVFRSYLRSQGACIQAMRVTRPVWKRFEYWLASRRRKVVRS